MLLYPCLCAARPRDPEIKQQAFFSHTGRTLPGESDPCAPRLVREVTNFLDKMNLASFYDVDNREERLGMQWAPQIMKEVKSSSVFVAILTPAFSQRFWPMYELYLALEAAEQPQSKRSIVPVLYGTTYDHLLQNFKKIDPRASWPDYESKEEVIKSSVKNLNTLSKFQGIPWIYASFDDKNSIATFGKLVAEKVGGIL